MKERIDILLAEKGFFDSREKARRAVMAGIVVVNDKRIDKPGEKVDSEAIIRLKGEVMPYVSRGGLKLEKAIKEFGLDFTGAKVIDIGASTGGFTDCALQAGAEKVYSVDVGTNQLDWKLRQDIRVKSLENKHIKDLTMADIDGSAIDMIVIDVSFISLTSVLYYAKQLLKKEGKIVALIKPQFEVGRENIDKGGIVKDFSKHIEAITKVRDKSQEIGLGMIGLTVSPITGTKGNVEYLALISESENNFYINIESIVEMGKNVKKGAE